MADEMDLVRRSAAGDAAAFGALFERYADDVYRLARSMGHAGEEAEDVMQDTFLAAFEGIGRFRGRASFKTWLLAILFRQSSRRHRYLGRRKTEYFDEYQPAPGNGRARVNVAAGIDSRMDAHTMLDSLSPDHRAVLVLRELEGLGYDEIAATLSVPRGTVESRLHRARAQLRAHFYEYQAARARRPGKPEESRHD